MYVNCPDERNVGLFGDVTGVNFYKSTIKNLEVSDSKFIGSRCIGGVVGHATGVYLKNVKVSNNKLRLVVKDNEEIDGVTGAIGDCVSYLASENIGKEEMEVLLQIVSDCLDLVFVVMMGMI